MKISFRLLGLLLLAASVAIAHESPVDHVDREFRLTVKDGQFHVSYRIALTERAALLQLRTMDTDGDGRVTDAEADTFFAAQTSTLAGLLKLELGGRPVALTPTGPIRRDAKFGQSYTFTAPLGTLAAGQHPGRLSDGYSRMYPGAFRWISPGEGGPKDVRVEPVIVPKDEGRTQRTHAPWIELTFNLVVPQ